MPLFNPQITASVPLQTSSAATQSSLSVGTTGTTIAADTTRKALTISNKSAVSIYVNVGSSTPTAAANMIELVSGAYYEFPTPIYTGLITLAAASGSGNSVQIASFN
jgi:hypothetical protein